MAGRAAARPWTPPFAGRQQTKEAALTAAAPARHPGRPQGCVIQREQWDKYQSRVAGSTLKILNILGRYGIKATFFILGWVAERRPQIVKQIQAAGHEIGSHGYAHRIIYQQTPDEFASDVRKGMTDANNQCSCPELWKHDLNRGDGKFQRPTFLVLIGMTIALTVALLPVWPSLAITSKPRA
jgi:hypothetical protein